MIDGLIEFLKDCGLCEICQLRYTHASENDYIEKNQKKLDERYERKKFKLEVCPTCLGLFSAEFQIYLRDRILNITNISEYESKDIILAFSMPIMIHVRQLAMWYALLERFDKSFSTEKAPDVPIKDIIKFLLKHNININLPKKEDNCLLIDISLSHIDEVNELPKLKQFHTTVFSSASQNNKREISRGVIEKQYTPKLLNSELFKKFLPVPPRSPMVNLNINSINVTGPTIYVAGRYRKLSRELSQTPWILNGQRIMEESVEEIISQIVTPYINNNKGKVIFMSSGREDVDVRCLGDGRPFVLEIHDSRRINLPIFETHRMECAIEKTNKVSVRNLQIIPREELIYIKSGEEQKRKCYQALCILQQSVTLEILHKLNLPHGFKIEQKTPIRVLHRRPLHTRPRIIYSIKASVYIGNPKLIILDIVSQAGTYIKELVHGEFGRTTPSITSIIGRPVDIVALDVMSIDIEWPKNIDDPMKQKCQ